MLVEAFNDYVCGYDLSDRNIALKYAHSFRVMNLQVKYAKKLGFSPEDVEIARVIGLLHDFGRFEQLRVYHTYDDSASIDHANYSCDQLFKKGNIKKFVTNEEWYPIIEFAIRNHNKRVIEDCDDERTLMHAKLIRDTDKIDIIYLMGTLKQVKIKPIKARVNKKVLEGFYNHEQIDSSLIKNKNDDSVIRYAFAFDINNTICLKELRRNYKTYYEVQKGNKDLDGVYKETLKYIKERLKNEGIR